MATDPLKKLLGIPDAPTPEEALSILAPNQASDLTGYFHQLDMPHGVEVPGITSRVDAEEKRQQEQTDAENKAQIASLPDVSAEADKAQAEKLALAGEPARVAGKNAIDLEHVKQGPLETLLNGQPSSTSGPMQFKPTVTESGITMTGVPEPAQVLNQQHAAQIGLSQYPKMREIIDTLDKHGMIGPIAGRAADIATSTGLDKVFLSPEASRAFNDFKAQASLMKSNMAMVHGGSRGGGSPAIAKRFDDLVNTAQTPAALKGAIDAFERWQTQYANAKNSDEMDAADAALGVTGGQYEPPDVYANPDYQPK